jgi:uncharacterized protein YbjT (DUF2867 family)
VTRAADPPTTGRPPERAGPTGSLGGKVVDELLGRGKNVRALVRPTTDASRLETRGVEIARGDMLDLDSLAFLDQIATMAGNPIDKGGLAWIGKTTVPLTFVHTSDLAAYLAAAVDAEADNGERIDTGWDRPVSMRGMADLMGNRAGKEIKVRAVPSVVARAAGAIAGRFILVKDMAAMFSWFEQRPLCRPPPPPGAAVRPGPHRRGRPRPVHRRAGWQGQGVATSL